MERNDVSYINFNILILIFTLIARSESNINGCLLTSIFVLFVQKIKTLHGFNFKACCSCWCCYTSQFPVTQNLPTHPRDSSSRISKPENTPFYFLCYFHFSLLLLHMLLKGIQKFSTCFPSDSLYCLLCPLLTIQELLQNNP